MVIVFALVLAAAAATGAPPAPTLRLPGTAAPVRYEADLSVDPASDSFRGSIDIDLELAERSSFLWLNGERLVVSSASIAQGTRTIAARAVATTTGFLGFAFDAPVAAGRATLHATWTGEISSDEITGLFRQEQEGRRYAFTQFEELGARRVFPCFDEPGFKTPWRLTLRVPTGLVAAANTPVESERRSGRTRIVRFGATKPLPSYLVAFAIGPFDVIDLGRAGRARTPLRLLVMKGHGRDATVAARAVPAILPVLERYFDGPFPFEKLDVVAVPSFAGAMENAGLITTDEPLLSLPQAERSVARERGVVLTMAHEMAHQWFGDMVTMAWWDDIWLNESFATWMEAKVGAALHPEWDIDGFIAASRTGAMSEDTLVSAREIRQPILTADDILGAFDGITYEKGAAILSMFEDALGPDVFRRGVDDYLRAHAWGTATTSDLLDALGKAAKRDVASDFQTFLDQPGVPVVTAGLDCGPAAPPRASLEQHRLLPLGTRGADRARWRIPICLRVGIDGKTSETCRTLTEEKEAIPLGTDRCPDWLELRTHGNGYYRVRYDGDLLDRLVARIDDLDSAERVVTLDDTLAIFEAGQAGVARTLRIAEKAARSKEPRVVAGALAIAVDVDSGHLVPESLRDHYARWIRDTFGDKARELGWEPKPREPATSAAVRLEIIAAMARDGADPEFSTEAANRARAWLANAKAPETDLVRVALVSAAWRGDAALFSDFEAAAAAARSDTRRRARIYEAELLFPDPALFRRALTHVDDPQLSALQSLELASSAFQRRENRDAALAWYEEHFESIAQRTPTEVSAELMRVGSELCDTPRRDALKAFFAPKASRFTGGPRAWDQTLEQIDLCIARRAAQEDEVAAFFRAR